MSSMPQITPSTEIINPNRDNIPLTERTPLPLKPDQTKVILKIIICLSLLGTGALLILAMPQIAILTWPISLGVSCGLIVTIVGSILFL